MPQPYRAGPNPAPLTADITTGSPARIEPAAYCDQRRFAALQSAKRAVFAGYRKEDYNAARDATNPFEAIGTPIGAVGLDRRDRRDARPDNFGFIGRAAVKLANIDAVYDLVVKVFDPPEQGDPTGTAGAALQGVRGDLQLAMSTKPFTFCDIAAGPGSFTQYVQFRRPAAVGFGMTLLTPGVSTDWATDKLDMARFSITWGKDGSGNLYTQWDDFTRFVSENGSPDGVDLVMADGGFELGEAEYENKEFLNSRLLLVQALVGVTSARPGGDFLLKTFGAVGAVSAQILYLLALSFEEISLFKPVSSRPATEEVYLVCRRRLPHINPRALGVLKAAANKYTDKKWVTGLIRGPLPADFTVWLTQQNDRSISAQLEAVFRILEYLGGKPRTMPEYFVPKFGLIWGLGDEV